MLSETEMVALEERVMERFRNRADARQIFPIKNEEWEHDLPVIHKEAKPTPETFDSDIDFMVDAVVSAENKLLFTGEHKDWEAFGITGLATVDGRYVLASSGEWPECAIADISEAKELLSKEFLGNFVLVVPTEIGVSLEAPLWIDDHHEKPSISYENYLIEQKLIAGIVKTPDLFTKNGCQDSVLLVVPDIKHFWARQGLPPQVHVWYSKDETSMVFRETIGPVIEKPSAIVEITNIKHNP